MTIMLMENIIKLSSKRIMYYTYLELNRLERSVNAYEHY